MKILKLIIKNSLRHKLRTSLTILGIVIAVIAFGLLRTVVTVWDSSVDAASANRLITRHSVSFIFPLPYAYKQKIENVEGVEKVSFANWFGGVYKDKMYGTAVVSLIDGKLFLQFTPSPTFNGTLNHYQYDMFYIDWEDEFLTRGWMKFEMDFNGLPNKLTLEVPNSPDFIFTELLFERTK